jgi:hypothetical protein
MCQRLLTRYMMGRDANRLYQYDSTMETGTIIVSIIDAGLPTAIRTRDHMGAENLVARDILRSTKSEKDIAQSIG